VPARTQNSTSATARDLLFANVATGGSFDRPAVVPTSAEFCFCVNSGAASTPTVRPEGVCQSRHFWTSSCTDSRTIPEMQRSRSRRREEWSSSIREELGGLELAPARSMRPTAPRCLLPSRPRPSASTFATAEPAPASRPSSCQSRTPRSSAQRLDGRRRVDTCLCWRAGLRGGDGCVAAFVPIPVVLGWAVESQGVASSVSGQERG
jgi:hypothetical protein